MNYIECNFDLRHVVRGMTRCEVRVEGHVINLCHNPKSDTLALQLEDGQIRRVHWGKCC